MAPEPVKRGAARSPSGSRKERDARYNRSEKGRARHARWYTENHAAIREQRRTRYEELRDEGMCTKCAKDIALTQTLCWKCSFLAQDYNLCRIR